MFHPPPWPRSGMAGESTRNTPETEYRSDHGFLQDFCKARCECGTLEYCGLCALYLLTLAHSRWRPFSADRGFFSGGSTWFRVDRFNRFPRVCFGIFTLFHSLSCLCGRASWCLLLPCLLLPSDAGTVHRRPLPLPPPAIWQILSCNFGRPFIPPPGLFAHEPVALQMSPPAAPILLWTTQVPNCNTRVESRSLKHFLQLPGW